MNQIKHIFLIVIAMLPCRAMMAQDYLLDHYYSDDGVDRVQFYYNANNLLESYHSTTNMGGEIEDYIVDLFSFRNDPRKSILPTFYLVSTGNLEDQDKTLCHSVVRFEVQNYRRVQS